MTRFTKPSNLRDFNGTRQSKNGFRVRCPSARLDVNDCGHHTIVAGGKTENLA
jgi:hypothetical protein